MLTLLRSTDRLALAVSLATLLASLSGCGGDSRTKVVVTNGTGTAVVVVTDAPSDEFLQIWLTVTKVELLGANGPFTLFEGRRVLDLLALRDDVRLLSLGHDVPAGDWSKIRLTVEDIELIRRVAEGDVEGEEVACPADVIPGDGFVCESIAPRIAANGKIDLGPRGPISVRPGELVFLQLDIDAVKSIHIHETGSDRFQFRPVVFVDAFTLSAPPRPVRIEGTIEEIDLATQKLLLCGTHRVFRAAALEDPGERSRCVDVRIGPETSTFDADGEPASLEDLAAGDEIAALGRFRIGTGETLVFDAVWIQQDGFAAGLWVSGEVLEGVAGDEFIIAPDADGPIQSDALVVRLRDGATLFSRAGQPLDPSDLEPGLRVRAFGVFIPLRHPTGPRLDASLVFAHAPVELVRVRGTVTQPFAAADRTIEIHATTDTAVGPLCIALEPGDGVFRIADEGAVLLSERIEPSQLQVGEVVDVYGRLAQPCFDAAALISFGAGD